MPSPLAYFLTWTCYGQRLPGDARGSTDRYHNQLGTPAIEPNPVSVRIAEAAMRSSTLTLTDAMRRAVEAGIRALCDERAWKLIALNVRSTHVHVIVNCRSALSPERTMGQFKARGTRAMREAGLIGTEAPIWTRHGSTRWINHPAGLYAAIAYVNDWQSGPNREILEAHRALIRTQLVELREWLRSCPAPDDPRRIAEGAEFTTTRFARGSCATLNDAIAQTPPGRSPQGHVPDV